MKKLLALITSLSLLLTVAGTAAAKTPTKPSPDAAPQTDNLPGPLAIKQQALKAKAQEMVLTGKATPRGKNKVVKVGQGQYVQLGFEGEDNLFTLLGEFGDEVASHNHGGTIGVVDHGGAPGPAHNEIPQPDRSVDNTTIWVPDFNQQHYQDILYSKTTFPSMANFYLEQSSGKYSINGYVSDWVQVPFNESAYGSNYCGSIVCTRDIGRFLVDQTNAWYQAQLDSGKTAAEIDDFLAQFDVWDRYDHDGDGNFDEPDGYIDHFQSVHAGQGEETGGGAEGTDAIWSHRSYANAGFPAGSGPTVDGEVVPFGGLRIGDSKYWIGDYTIEPENGGVGVFSHEFAHDKGLPDEYDTSGNTGGAENSTAWWTIMSQGSYGTQTDDLGTAPIHFNAWDKFQLGFLDNYAVASSEDAGSVRLGPAEYNTKNPQALFVVLPDKKVTFEVGAPYQGDWMYFSGSGNEFDHTMTRSVTLPAGAASLSAKVRYDAELDYDYGFVTVNGAPVATNLSSGTDPNGNNPTKLGITGSSNGDWVDLTADLSAFADQTVEIGFEYKTDPAVAENGFFFDNIAITGQDLDGAETDTVGWTFDGFDRVQSTIEKSFFNAYVAEFRQYRGYDASLQKGPYNFGFLDNEDLQNYVEHFPYQEGLLISYWDESFNDNNVGDHPGGGLILPVDSHPTIETWSDGTQMRPRLQSYDSTFGLKPTKKLTLHNNSVPTTIASKPGVSVFDDTKDWWVASDPSDAPDNGRYQAGWNSVNVPKTGTTIRAGSNSGSFMWVYLNQ